MKRSVYYRSFLSLPVRNLARGFIEITLEIFIIENFLNNFDKLNQGHPFYPGLSGRVFKIDIPDENPRLEKQGISFDSFIKGYCP